MVARNAFALVLGQVITTALGLALSAGLGRYLGVDDYGLYYLMTTISAFAYVFVEWGQPLFVIRQVARDPRRSGELLGTALALRVVLGVASAIVTALAILAIGYDARTRRYTVLLLIAGLPLFLAQGYGMVFRARQRMGRDAAVSVAGKLLLLCIVLPALARGAGIPGVIAGQAGAGVAALGMAAFLYRHLGAPPLRISSGAARELMRGGTPILAMSVAVWAQPYFDAVFLSKLAPPSSVGWYGAARTIIGTLMAPATILATAAYPNLARSATDRSRFREELRSVSRAMLALGALAGSGTYLFADAVVGLIYGSGDFDPAATILKVFAPGFFLLFIDILLGAAVFAAGRGTGIALVKIASVAVGAGLDLTLIPLFQHRLGNGGIGVVVAFAVSEVVMFAGLLAILRRRYLGGAMALDVVRALGAAGATLLLFRLVPSVALSAGILLYVALFATVSLGLGLLKWSDLALVRHLARPGGRLAGPGEPQT